MWCSMNILNHNNSAPEDIDLGSSLSIPSSNTRKRPHSLINNSISHQQPSMKPLSASITLPITATDYNNNQLGIRQQMHASVSSISLLEPRDNSINPQEYFLSLLKSRGYPGTTFCSLKCGYHNTPTVSSSKCVFVAHICCSHLLVGCGARLFVSINLYT